MSSLSLSWREQLLPGPAATTGYRTVLLVGTTGAGKSTLLRQLIGTDPTTEAFPATATFKTTTAETEVLCAPGDYYAVAVFAEKARVRAEVGECVQAAEAALEGQRPTEVARDALAAHGDERLRLEYLLGPAAVDEALEQLAQARVDDGLPGCGEALADRFVGQIGQRFGTLRYGQLLWDDNATDADSWPHCWRFTCEDRATFLATLRRLAGNDRGSYGALLSPMVEAIRVRGPFHPTWLAELPYLMVVDTEGLGHVPTSVAALPLAVLSQLDRADRIIVVDDASHPMQAAPLAALRQLATSGHIDKVAVCFTHLDEVQGPNVRTDDDRQALLRRAVNQALRSLDSVVAAADVDRLARQVDGHTFYLGHLAERLEVTGPGHGATVAELCRLLGWLRHEGERISVTDLRPAYRLGDLRARLTAEVERFAANWRDRLAQTHWRQVQALCVRLGDGLADGYGELQPVADLASAAAEALRSFASRPVRWRGLTPSDDQAAALVDAFSRAMSDAVIAAAREVLTERARAGWRAAAEVAGAGAAGRRVALIDEGVLATLLVPEADGPPFVTRLIDDVRAVAASIGFEVGDTVLPGGGSDVSTVLDRPTWHPDDH